MLEFTPSTVDDQGARNEVERLAEGLAGATDEATGHPLDNLINAWADKWVAEVEAEHAVFLARVEAPLGEANARLGELDIERDHDGQRLNETSVARVASVSLLRGGAEDKGFGGTGYDDPTLLAGRPRSTYLHAIAMLCAAAADVSAFIQVMELLLPQDEWIVGMAVGGLTVIALFLAHIAGVQLRDRKAGVKWIRWVGATVSLLVWATIGGLATWARVIAPKPVDVGLDLDFEPQAAEVLTSDFTYVGAGVFLALYVGSGLAACVGAYLTHNRMQTSYHTAVRKHRKASDSAMKTARAHGEATASLNTQAGAKEAAVRLLAKAISQRLALSEELKQYARVLFASRSRDPALTDAILDQDQRPYVFHPQSPNGSSRRTP